MMTNTRVDLRAAATATKNLLSLSVFVSRMLMFPGFPVMRRATTKINYSSELSCGVMFACFSPRLSRAILNFCPSVSFVSRFLREDARRGPKVSGR